MTAVKAASNRKSRDRREKSQVTKAVNAGNAMRLSDRPANYKSFGAKPKKSKPAGEITPVRKTKPKKKAKKVA